MKKDRYFFDTDTENIIVLFVSIFLITCVYKFVIPWLCH